MAEITVLIPTYNHCDTLIYTLETVLSQTVQDFEIFVVGDGAPDRTREIMSDFCKRDSRICFFDNPKGLRHGEMHRHAALEQATGTFVCYLSDDDLWLPHHLDVLTKLLRKADFAHTLHTYIKPDGSINANLGSLNDEQTRNRMLTQKWNFFGPTVVGHTLEIYRRLPYGWHPAPNELWTDLHMWRQFLELRDIRLLSDTTISSLHFPSSLRHQQTIEESLDELAYWWNWLQKDPIELITTLNAQVLNLWNTQLTWYQNKKLAAKYPQAD